MNELMTSKSLFIATLGLILLFIICIIKGFNTSSEMVAVVFAIAGANAYKAVKYKNPYEEDETKQKKKTKKISETIKS